MLPILYPANTAKADFLYNGYGFIKNCTKCSASEERNGPYELSMEMLTNDRLARTVMPGMFVKSLANPYDPAQLFEIYNVSYTADRITANAQHIRYIAYANATNEKVAAAAQNLAYTPGGWWQHLVDNDYLCVPSLWDFSSDITTQGIVSALAERPVRLGDFFQGAQGSMLDVFGGEYHFNNFNIELLQRRGTDTGICLRYGSNISSYAQDSDITTVYTHLQPYAYVKAQYADSKEEYHDMAVYHNSVIDLQNTLTTYQRVLTYDFSDYFSDDIMLLDSNAVPTNYYDLQQKLATVANNYVSANRAALTEPTVNITVDVAETLQSLQTCKLCDTAQIYFDRLNRSVTSKVVKTEFDALTERYTKITLGTVKKNLADLFTNKNIGGV